MTPIPTAAMTTAELITHRDIYVDGAWVPSAAVGTIDVIDPTTEAVIARVPAGTAADVDAAVRAARAAFPGWAATPVAQRAGYLTAIADALTAQRDDVAAIVTRELGSPLKISKLVHVGSPIGAFRYYAELAPSFDWETEAGNSLLLREPVGVVAAITPWNYPLHQVAAKLAAALAAGCTVVLKPSELTPLSAYRLVEIVDSVGLPAGVVNLVIGEGPVVGEALVGHPLVDMVSFTGSGRAGKRISQLGAETVKRVSLELGGKSASVLLPDLDDDGFAAAVTASVSQCFTNSGQRCTAFSRLLVPRERLAAALAVAAATADAHTTGDPAAGGTRLGPLVSAAQRDRVRGFIDRAVADGARVVAGGSAAPEGLDTGFFVPATVITGAAPDSEIAREEVFGPVVTVFGYDDVDEAVQLANGTDYGLAAGVYGATTESAVAVARRLRAGQVDVNNGRWNFAAPFGGYKQSGNGREFGVAGLEEFLETKAVQR